MAGALIDYTAEFCVQANYEKPIEEFKLAVEKALAEQKRHASKSRV